MSRTNLRRFFAVLLLLGISVGLLRTSAYAQEGDSLGFFDEAFYTEMAENKTSAHGFEYVEGDETQDIWDKEGLKYDIQYADGKIVDITLFTSIPDEAGQRIFGFNKVIDSEIDTTGRARTNNMIYWTNFADLPSSTSISDIEDELFIELSQAFAQNPTEANFLELLERAK